METQIWHFYQILLADLDDVRTYGYKAKRVVALIYTHFKNELGV